jgi:hypothetical protein
MEHNFKAVEGLSLENSFGTIKQEDGITLNVTVGIKSDTYGWFEFYDEETGGDEWYAEGGLWFDNKTVTDYDGVFSLPSFVISKLEELGYDCEEIKS